MTERKTNTIAANMGKISKLAWRLIRHREAMSWGDAFRAAIKLLRRRTWMQLRNVASVRLDKMARRYRALGDMGRARAFFDGSSAVISSTSFASFTRMCGVGPSLRLEVAAAALPYGSRRWESLFGTMEVR